MNRLLVWRPGTITSRFYKDGRKKTKVKIIRFSPKHPNFLQRLSHRDSSDVHSEGLVRCSVPGFQFQSSTLKRKLPSAGGAGGGSKRPCPDFILRRYSEVKSSPHQDLSIHPMTFKLRNPG